MHEEQPTPHAEQVTAYMAVLHDGGYRDGDDHLWECSHIHVSSADAMRCANEELGRRNFKSRHAQDMFSSGLAQQTLDMLNDLDDLFWVTEQDQALTTVQLDDVCARLVQSYATALERGAYNATRQP